MVNINLHIKHASEIRMGKRVLTVKDLEEAEAGDFLIYVGDEVEFLTTGKLYFVKEVNDEESEITIHDNDEETYTLDYNDDDFILLKPSYTEREKEFIRFGRQPEQFKIGDVVQLDDGVIGVITNIYDEDKDDKPVYYVNTGVGFGWGNSIRLIAPVEHTNQVK